MKNIVLATASCLPLLCAAGANAQQILPSSLGTADNDQIGVAGMTGNGNGDVRLCLQTRSGMWKKDIRVSGVGVLRSEGGTTDCILVSPGLVRIEMIKAKMGGVMTGVGYGSLDLTGWGGGTVTIDWQRD